MKKIKEILCNGCSEILQEGYNFCPYCGTSRDGRYEIFERMPMGSKILVKYDGGSVLGRLSGLYKSSVLIKTFNASWVKVKYEAIRSVENFGKMKNNQDELTFNIDVCLETKEPKKKISFLQGEDLKVMLERIVDKEGIDYSRKIETNAIVSDFYGPTFTVNTDEGEKFTCMKNKIIKLDKSLLKTGEFVGYRVFCGPLSLDGICRCAIQEMTYKTLLEKSEASLVKNATAAKKTLETIIPYLKQVIKNPDAVVELEKLESYSREFFNI